MSLIRGRIEDLTESRLIEARREVTSSLCWSQLLFLLPYYTTNAVNYNLAGLWTLETNSEGRNTAKKWQLTNFQEARVRSYLYSSYRFENLPRFEFFLSRALLD